MSDRVSPTAVAACLKELKAALPSDRLIEDPERLAEYGRDWSKMPASAPDLVVKPQTTEEVQTILQSAHVNHVPVTPRGLGTGKAGGAIPILGGIVLSTEKMTRVTPVDADNLTVTSAAGATTRSVMDAVEEAGFFYPPDPNSFDICSIGGNVATNAGGPRALKYGVTKHYVLEVEVVLADGRLMRFGKHTPKYVSGYDLCALLVGSEGTLGVITQCTLRVVARPQAVFTAVIAFSDVEAACRSIPSILRCGITPRTLELLDDAALAAVHAERPGHYPETGAVLLLETDGSQADHAEADLMRAAEACLKAGALDVQVATNSAQRERLWAPRRYLSESLARTAAKKLSEDVVVPRGQLPALVKEVRRIGARHGIRVATYGHAGDGNLHVNLLFDEDQDAPAQKAALEVLSAAVDLGGALSGEHGIGLSKRAAFGIEHPPAQITLHKHLKQLLDPHGILNPAKIWRPDV